MADNTVSRSCRKCGAVLAERDRFCPQCGAPVHKPPLDPEPGDPIGPVPRPPPPRRGRRPAGT